MQDTDRSELKKAVPGLCTLEPVMEAPDTGWRTWEGHREEVAFELKFGREVNIRNKEGQRTGVP